MPLKHLFEISHIGMVAALAVILNIELAELCKPTVRGRPFILCALHALDDLTNRFSKCVCREVNRLFDAPWFASFARAAS